MCIRDRPTRDQLERELVKSGAIKEAGKFAEEANKRREEVRRLELKLQKAEQAGNRKMMLDYASKLATLRAENYRELIQRNAILGNSADSKAEEARTIFLMTRSIYYKDTEELVWSNYADYLRERNHKLVNSLSQEYISFTTGITTNFMEEFPEVKILEQSSE